MLIGKINAYYSTVAILFLLLSAGSSALAEAEDISLNADQWVAEGSQQLQSKNYENAIKAYTRAIELRNDHLGAVFGRGYCYSIIKETDLAIADFSRVIAINPNIADVYYLRGLCYGAKAVNNLRYYYSEVDDQSKVIQLNPKFAEAYYERGLAYIYLHNYASALKDYDVYTTLKPDDARGFYNRAICYQSEEKIDLAIKDYEVAIKLNPADEHIYYNRGLLYYAKGKYELAIQDFSVGISIKNDIPGHYYMRGITYFALKKYDLALEDLDKSIALKHIKGYFGKALVCEKIGQYDKEIELLTLFLQYNSPYNVSENMMAREYLDRAKRRQGKAR